MKNKLLLVAIFIFTAIGAFSQQSDIFLLGKMGYHRGSPSYKYGVRDRFAVGADVRVGLTDEIKIVSSLAFMFPNNGVIGLDVNVNALYSFPIKSEGRHIEFYPLVGLNMDNNRYNKDKIKRSWTTWGANMGGGADYYITKYDFINMELQYTFFSKYVKLMFGYGHRF